jgi:SAM-dependent methyltransferase
MLDAAAVRILDVGCGAGDNARLIKHRNSQVVIHGITRSAEEAERAAQVLSTCHCADIEEGIPAALLDEKFDAMIFSHVLEHLVEPWSVLADYSGLLRPGGEMLVAVPNVAHWRIRSQLMRGMFEYQSTGVLDITHLRFFTFNTAPQLLFGSASKLRLIEVRADGDVPQWILRRHILSTDAARYIDAFAARRWPNLFSAQVLIKATKVAD